MIITFNFGGINTGSREEEIFVSELKPNVTFANGHPDVNYSISRVTKDGAFVRAFSSKKLSGSHTVQAIDGVNGTTPVRTTPVRIATFGDSTSVLFSGEKTGNYYTNCEVIDIGVWSTTTTDNITKNINRYQLETFYPNAKFVRDCGVGGDQTSTMLNRETTGTAEQLSKSISSLLNSNPEAILLRGGSINNISAVNSTTYTPYLTNCIAQHKQILLLLASRGAHVIDSGIFGYSVLTNPDLALVRQAVGEFNTAIKAFIEADTSGKLHWNPASELVRDNTMAFLPDMAPDGTHVGILATRIVSEGEGNILTAVFGKSGENSFEGTNLISNGYGINLTGSQTPPGVQYYSSQTPNTLTRNIVEVDGKRWYTFTCTTNVVGAVSIYVGFPFNPKTKGINLNDEIQGQFYWKVQHDSKTILNPTSIAPSCSIRHTNANGRVKAVSYAFTGDPVKANTVNLFRSPNVKVKVSNEDLIDSGSHLEFGYAFNSAAIGEVITVWIAEPLVSVKKAVVKTSKTYIVKNLLPWAHNNHTTVNNNSGVIQRDVPIPSNSMGFETGFKMTVSNAFIQTNITVPASTDRYILSFYAYVPDADLSTATCRSGTTGFATNGQALGFNNTYANAGSGQLISNNNVDPWPAWKFERVEKNLFRVSLAFQNAGTGTIIVTRFDSDTTNLNVIYTGLMLENVGTTNYSIPGKFISNITSDNYSTGFNSIANIQEYRNLPFNNIRIYSDSIWGSGSPSIGAMFNQLLPGCLIDFLGGTRLTVDNGNGLAVKNRMTGDDFSKSLVIINGGRNDVGTYTTPQQFLDGVNECIAVIGHSNYAIMGILAKYHTTAAPTGGEPIGSVVGDQIIAANALLKATFGDKFIDVQSEIVNAYNPLVPADVTNYNLKMRPPSIADIAGDGIHPGQVEAKFIARLVANKVKTLYGI